jgi:subtilase family serine protease
VGGRVTFAVTVKNAGAVKSPAGSLSYYVDGVPAGKHLIEAVEPGAIITRQFTWTVQKQPFTLTAVVDEGAEIKDKDRSNNRKSVTLPAPDLVIDAVTWAPVMPAEIEQVTFNIVVRNQGYGASPAVLLYGYIDGAAVPFSIITGEINPGGTATVTCKYEFISGFHAIRFAADGNDALTESSETNNAKTINVTVQPLPGKTTVAAPTGPAAAPASKPAPAVSSNKTQAAATTGNVTNDLQSAPSKIQSILQNRWLIPGVAVLGVSAIGVLLVFRKRAKKK